MKRRGIVCVFVLAVLFGVYVPAALPASEYYLEAYDYYLNVPESWSVYSADSEDYLVFQDERGEAFFQVQTLRNLMPGREPSDVCREVLSNLRGEIETAPFIYNGRKAAYGTVRFSTGSAGGGGFTVCIDLGEKYVLLFAYTGEEILEQYMPLLLSCLDGFSFSRKALLLPGPVSQFFYAFPGKNKKTFRIRFQGEELPLSVDPGEADASQVVIEREARILADLEKLDIAAWERYYRMIYRDSYSRVLPAATQIKEALDGKDRYTAASELLTWLQSFSYLRTGTVSDLQSPLQTLVSGTGDCDSLGLLYCMILNAVGIDAILLVSTEYAHSIVGVDVPGDGARFRHEETDYLAAELTDNVDIGLIDRTMADPAKWVPISFAPKK
jgi:hypothetical protein